MADNEPATIDATEPADAAQIELPTATDDPVIDTGVSGQPPKSTEIRVY